MLWALVVWTVSIWVTRIVNILDDPDGSAGELVSPALLIALSGAAVARRVSGRPWWGALALAGATIGVWALRLPLMLTADHSAGFIVVHAVLAAVSIGLAVPVLLSERRTVADGSAGEGDDGGSAGDGDASEGDVTAPEGAARPD